MKKTLFVLVVALLTSMVASAQVTDTIVSTEPSNRNVLLEEYTGINCGYCPSGHKIANQIQAAHPGRVCIINIHQGGYAANTYTTQFGNPLANQYGVNSYPSGTVNRHSFNGTSVLARNQWSSKSNQILGMSSPVNIAAEGTLDMTTRTLNVRVQLYYTGTQTVASNMLNVAILQDNVLGPQSGASQNPAQVVDGQYNHMHMLRHLITGQWGETIDSITPGTLVEKTYEYVIPAMFGSPNAIDAWLEDLEFIAFVCEGHKEVLTAIEIPVERVNQPANAMRIVNLTEGENTECNNSATASFKFKNTGIDTATSMIYTYTINGTTQTDSWSGSVANGATETVQIPTFNVNVNLSNNLSVQITKINGADVELSPATLAIKKNLYQGGGRMTFKFVTDACGSEDSFKFFDPDGIVVLQGSGFPDITDGNNYQAGTTENVFAFLPSKTGCYRLEVNDGYGDGMNMGLGEGYFQLIDQDGVQIFRDNGQFGKKAVYMIDVTYPAAIEDVTAGTTIYPNPVTDVININTTENVQRVEIFNMQGQLVKAEIGDVNSISVKSLANGLYTLKLTTDNGTSMHKIIKK